MLGLPIFVHGEREAMNGSSEVGERNELLTVREVAGLLRVSQNCVYELVGKGRLACYRVGTGRGAIRIRRGDVEAYLAGSRVDKAEPAGRACRPRLRHLTL
jgi:excisionase family DNA binding protein